MRRLSPSLVRLPLLVLALGACVDAAVAQAPTPPLPPPAISPDAPHRTAEASLARALQDHEWTLRSSTDAAGKAVDMLLPAGKPFVMRFKGPGVNIRGGCNTMNAHWRLTPRNVLTITRAASTQMACEPALMAADAALAQALSSPVQVRVEPGDKPMLHLVTGAQQTLSFEGRRTLTSQFGEPTRVFLEVAAQRVACTPAVMPPTTCLQVREVKFDDKGLRAGKPGPWRAFYGEIAGYTHTPGTSNVLRINRYTRPQPPADKSAYIYELDMVVESRTEQN